MMNAKVEPQSSRLDTVKLVAALVVVVGAIVGYYQFADFSTPVRIMGVLVAAAVAVAIASQTQLGRTFWGFLQESQIEVRKVVWPTRTETMQATLAVVVMVIVLGVLLWMFDMVLLKVVRMLTGQGS